MKVRINFQSGECIASARNPMACYAPAYSGCVLSDWSTLVINNSVSNDLSRNL